MTEERVFTNGNERYIKKISLVSGGGKVEEYDIRECFSHRRSRRNFWPGAMTRRQLSYLLWYTARIQNREGEEIFTPVPSPGAIHPLNVSIALINILDMEKGLYRYSPSEHCLYLVERMEELREELFRIFPGQEFVADASFLFGISAVSREVQERYPRDWERLVLLEAGHMGQQLMLACESLHLATCPIGIFNREEANKFFRCTGGEEMTYFFPVGITP